MEYKWYITPEEYKLAESNGIAKNALSNRVRDYGWDIERACTEPLKKQFLKQTLSEEIIKTLKNNNITINAFTKRIINLGWSINKATNTPTLSKYDAMIIANNSRRTISDEQYKAGEANGIARGTLKRRIMQSHWNIERAINTPIMNRSECSKLSCFSKNIYSDICNY